MELKSSLRRLMKERSISIRRLGEATGVPPSTIKTWLTGASPRSLEDVRAVARYFGVSMEFLVFGETDAAPQSLQELPLEEVFSGWLRVDIKRAIPLKKDEKK